ncbi:MAG: CocE/NonD family hydrolase [Deltaproteobacteria bacterium]|nr:CocE/NonD family hydrolase [Deltaproteobacteria bacterium]
MHKLLDIRLICALAAAALVIMIFLSYKKQAGQKTLSRFGRYEGYSSAIYDGSRRISDYLTLSYGTMLAYDLILPTRKGLPADRPLPVLFKYTPYLRTFTIFDEKGKNLIADLLGLGWKERAMLRIRYWLSGQGRFMDPLFRTKWLKNMVRHGYAVIVVERPGTGASFGIFDASHEPGGREASEILDWIASQPWCDGNIGMFGDSFQAMIQMAAAATGNPHLKAIFPTSTPMEMYSAIQYPGGIYNKAFASFFTWATSFLAANVITPVDGDKDGTLLARAREERSRSLPETTGIARNLPFRDSTAPGGIDVWQDRAALYPFVERINRSGIPVYMTNGWYDLFTADMFLWYHNLTVPRKLTVRPLDHSEVEKDRADLDYGAEAHRWFDYWLKGIRNGIMDEPPIHYYVMGAPKEEAWQTSDRWPLQNQKPTPFYFGPGRSGSIASVNDGFLGSESPTAPEAFDAYTVDYTTTCGKKSRWSAVNWPRHYPDMRFNDEKALTYTTPPLETDVEVTGHLVAHVWLTTEAPDLDLFVYLEEVNQKGSSAYVTEGELRISHRTLSRAPFDNLGLPFHSHYQRDLAPIQAGNPVEVSLGLLPTSFLFRKGNRIRVSVAFADADNFDTPVIHPAPRVRLLRDRTHPSLVLLPVVAGPRNPA